MANAVNRVVVGDRTIMSLLDADVIDPSQLKQGLHCYDKTGHRIVGSAQIFEKPTIYKSPLNGTDEFHTSVKQYRESSIDGYIYDTKEYFEKYIAYVGTNIDNIITQLFLNCRIKFPEYESAEYNIQQGQVTLNFNLDTLYIYNFYYNSAYKNSNLNTYRMNICSHGRFPIENIKAEFYVHYSDGTDQTFTINPANALSITFVKNNSEEYNRYKVANNLNFDIPTLSGKTINQIAIQSLKFSVSGDDGQFFNEGTSVDTRGLDEQSNITGYTNDNITMFYVDNSLTIPIGDSKVNFFINSSKQLIARYKSNDLVIQGANDNMYANGVNILQIFYLSNTAIFIMYNWRNGASTSLTTLNSNTIGKIIFIKHDDKLGVTAERVMFGGTKTFENSAVNGSVYAGKIFPLDFKEGAEWKIGIQYIRDSITNANVYNGRYSYTGRINFYVSTSVSRIMMQTVSTSVISSVASCVPSTGANIWFANTFGNIVNHYSMTSASVITRQTWMTRVANNTDSASGNNINVNNPNGFGDTVEPSVLGNMIFNQQMLGRLEDGTYLFCKTGDHAVMGGVSMYFEVWECLFDTVANHSVWIKKNSFFDLQSTWIENENNIIESPYILLKNNVLIDTHDGTLYQIMYGEYNKNGTTETGYYPKFIGRSNYIENKKATCRINRNGEHYILRPYQSYSIPTGQYSNLFGGIGCSQIEGLK